MRLEVSKYNKNYNYNYMFGVKKTHNLDCFRLTNIFINIFT